MTKKEKEAISLQKNERVNNLKRMLYKGVITAKEFEEKMKVI